MINEKRIAQHLRLFERALGEYRSDEPLSRFLSKFYRDNRQMGSSDRRMTSRFCYNYFRLGKAFASYSLLERLCFSEYLCERESDILAINNPSLHESIGDSLDQKIEKLASLHGDFLQQVFTFSEQVSANINLSEFIKSHFVQPHLYIRAKREKVKHIEAKLLKHDVPFEFDGNTTFTLSNGQNLKQISGINGDYEVQDISSQRTAEHFDIKAGQSWWDCCAASGGKSLLLLDQCPDIKLTVSDIRLSILRNLDERFEKARIKTPYQKKILNLSEPITHLMAGQTFDNILIDAPCSGSGTWGRTPEMMQQFSEAKISTFSNLQRSIVSNVLPYLKPGGQLIYITCSVFSEENEEIASFITSKLGMSAVKQTTLHGYRERADSMYVATFRKN